MEIPVILITCTRVRIELSLGIAHFEKEWWPGSRVIVQAIVGLFGGTLNAMTIANVPPNLPTITWAATLDPGYHSFPK